MARRDSNNLGRGAPRRVYICTCGHPAHLHKMDGVLGEPMPCQRPGCDCKDYGYDAKQSAEAERAGEL